MQIIKMVDVYTRQIGPQLNKNTFNDDKYYFQELDKILDILFETAKKRGLSWKKLADESGLHKKTVENLGERWTKRPQYRTVIKIAEVLGLTIQLHTVNKNTHSIKIAKAG